MQQARNNNYRKYENTINLKHLNVAVNIKQLILEQEHSLNFSWSQPTNWYFLPVASTGWSGIVAQLFKVASSTRVVWLFGSSACVG